MHAGMPGIERLRESVTALPSAEEVRAKGAQGWRLASIEWERDTAGMPPARIEVPYGLRVAADGIHLEEDPAEREIMVLIMDQIVDDKKLSDIVSLLNKRGLVTRYGAPWTAAAVFRLLPRTVDAGPQVFSSADWVEMRARHAGMV